MTKIQFELDGKQVEAKPGETIWQVAKRQGNEIPDIKVTNNDGRVHTVSSEETPVHASRRDSIAELRRRRPRRDWPADWQSERHLPAAGLRGFARPGQP